MLQYAPALKHFAGHLPLISPGYAASECGVIGLNINLMCAPEDVTYMLLPEKAYYEFIPVEHHNDEEVLEACDLEVGKEYEILITNIAGNLASFALLTISDNFISPGYLMYVYFGSVA